MHQLLFSLAALIYFSAPLAGCTTAEPAPLAATQEAPPSVILLMETVLQATPTPALTTAAPTFTPANLLTTTTSPQPVSTEEIPVSFAVIGDYGLAGEPAADVSALVLSWSPDFIITTGDNNYPSGAQDTIDANVGVYYHSYIYPYRGTAGPGAEINRFFPSLGNHDWATDQARPYLEYFTLPGNERYYDFSWGPLHLFALDSDSNEPDGVGASSAQAQWLRDQLLSSTAPWKIVYMHHPPYSSAQHGPVEWMRWPFKEWGATAVLAGHDHAYERLHIESMPYIVNGLGGGSIYNFSQIMDGSQVRFNADHGAMLVEATQTQITFQFITHRGEVIDAITLAAP